MKTKKSNQLGCYYCGKKKTSREHIPPRCLFPTHKDVPGKDYRSHPIIVPSCKKHNLDKSSDDEFLMACLAPVVGNNIIGYRLTKSKLTRAHSYRPKLINAVSKNRKDFDLNFKKGVKFPVTLGKPDIPRLSRSLGCIARGLYFHEYGSRFHGKCIVLPTFVEYQSDLEIINVLSQKLFSQEKKDWLKGGAHPEIFQYMIGPPDQHGLIPMSMEFYQGAQVLVTLQPTGVKLPHRTLSEATKENPIRIDIEFQ